MICSPEIHEAANIFPLDMETVDELAEDIRLHGQQEPIRLMDGKILDGRRRQLACQKANVTPIYRDVKVSDPVAFVISLNLYRRHLTAGQRAMCAARARELYDRLAKERMSKGGGDKKSAGAKSGMANLPHPITEPSTARDQAGKTFNVSGKSVDHASKVMKNAIPEVVKAVDEGRMAVSTAAILSSEPEDVQKAEAANPNRRRDYKSCSKPVEDVRGKLEQELADADAEVKERGVGVRLAYEAINCLTRIPKNDQLRKRGFQIVTDWIRSNK